VISFRRVQLTINCLKLINFMKTLKFFLEQPFEADFMSISQEDKRLDRW
jgi:hypothetical protein